MIANPEQSDSTGRTADGRFASGNKFGRGRPRREVEQEFLTAFVSGCTPDTLEEIVTKATEMALAGDIQAMKMLLQYAMPSHSVKMEILTKEEQFRVAGQTPAEGMATLLKRLETQLELQRQRESDASTTQQHRLAESN